MDKGDHIYAVIDAVRVGSGIIHRSRRCFNIVSSTTHAAGEWWSRLLLESHDMNIGASARRLMESDVSRVQVDALGGYGVVRL